MVGWAGASQDAPVSDNAGYANPVQSTTREIGVSGWWLVVPVIGGRRMMAINPNGSCQFIWIIAAVRRDSKIIKPVLYHIASTSEREARKNLVRDHICFFAGRVRVEVGNA